MTAIRSRHALIALVFALLATCFSVGELQARSESTIAIDATFGFANSWKRATWTPVRIAIDGAEEELEGRIVVTAIDNRGGEARFVQDKVIRVEAGKPFICWRYIRIGDPNRPVEVALEDTAGEVIASRSFALGDEALSFSRMWVVALGDAVGIDTLGSENLIDSSGTVDVSVVEASGIPDDRIGLEGVDLLVLPTAQTMQLAALDDQQVMAIQQWASHGGRILITAGASAEKALQAAPWLTRLLGIEDPSVRTVTVLPAMLESFVAAKTQLAEFESPRLEPIDGERLLTGRTRDRESFALIYERVYGFGRAIVVAADLDREPFIDWPERKRVLQKLFPAMLVDTRNRESAAMGGVQEGYQDLGGQLNASLDKPVGGAVPFSWVAGLMLIYLGLIGPLDYFLVNRWLGKPLLGWVTFLILVALGSGAVAYWSNQLRTAQVVCRVVEFVDVVPDADVARGRSWMRLQSGAAGGYSVAFDATGARLGWLGVAGSTYGGLEPPATLVQSPDYRILTTDHGAAIEGLPIGHAGSRGLEAYWTPTIEVAPQAGLERIPGSDLVRGDLQNPLAVDLLDGVLIFRNRAYLLPTRLTPGQFVRDVDRLNQRNFAWRLTRRQLLEGTSTTEPWNRSRTDDPRRIIEILQYYDAAGGKSYTGLTSRPLRELDLSYLLPVDRALLAGRIESSDSELRIETPDADAGVQLEKDVFIRIVLPVAGTRSSVEAEQ